MLVLAWCRNTEGVFILQSSHDSFRASTFRRKLNFHWGVVVNFMCENYKKFLWCLKKKREIHWLISDTSKIQYGLLKETFSPSTNLIKSSAGTSFGSGSLLISMFKNVDFFFSYPTEDSAWLNGKAGKVCGYTGFFVGCVSHSDVLFILQSCFYWLSWRHFLFFNSGGILCFLAWLFALMLGLRLSVCGYEDRFRDYKYLQVTL